MGCGLFRILGWHFTQPGVPVEGSPILGDPPQPNPPSPSPPPDEDCQQDESCDFDDIEVKFRAFISWEAISIDLLGLDLALFAGDNGDFSYAGGTARVQPTVVVTADPEKPAIVEEPIRKWGESKRYSINQGSEIPGSPGFDFILKPEERNNPKERETLPVTERNNKVSVSRTENTVKVELFVSGSNPVSPFRGTPDLDADVTVEIRQESAESQP